MLARRFAEGFIQRRRTTAHQSQTERARDESEKWSDLPQFTGRLANKHTTAVDAVTTFRRMSTSETENFRELKWRAFLLANAGLT